METLLFAVLGVLIVGFLMAFAVMGIAGLSLVSQSFARDRAVAAKPGAAAAR